MSASDVLLDGFGRVRELVHSTAAGLSAAELAFRPSGTGNSIGWLLWHLTRVQDDHLAAAAGDVQIWLAQDFVTRFGLPFDTGDIGYGHSNDDVAATSIVEPGLLLDYYDAVHAQTSDFLADIAEADFNRVIDDSYDPPVTLLVRLVSVLSDDLQHVGQAGYVRGLLPAD